MNAHGITKSATAKAMRTGRPALARLVDPGNPSVAQAAAGTGVTA